MKKLSIRRLDATSSHLVKMNILARVVVEKVESYICDVSHGQQKLYNWYL
jgi:hypothetical protein